MAPIAATLERLLDLPVFVENDANAGALAEVWFGNAGDVGNVLYVKTDTGVGAGIMLEQQLITGPRGMAGEIGHIPLMADGHACRCGQRACLETYVSMPDVLGRYAARTGRRIDKTTFFDSAKNGDVIAVELVEEANCALTLAVSSAAAILDLDQVIIDGIWGQFSRDFLDRIQAKVKATMDRTGLDKKVTVQPSGLGEDGDLLGAVDLASDRLFRPPDVLSGTDHVQQLVAQPDSERG